MATHRGGQVSTASFPCPNDTVVYVLGGDGEPTPLAVVAQFRQLDLSVLTRPYSASLIPA